MATPSSDSDGPPEIPEEEDRINRRVVRKTSLDLNNNFCSHIKGPTLSHHETSTGTKRVQRFSHPVREPAAVAKGNKNRNDPKVSSQEDLSLAFQLEDDNCVLRATPANLEFQLECTDHDSCKALKPLTKEVVLQNTTNYTVSFAVLPPSSNAFSVSCQRKKPFLSAGMVQRVLVSFIPDVYAPQSDFIKVVVSIRSAGDATGVSCNRRESERGKRFQDSLFLTRIPLRAVVRCSVRGDDFVVPPNIESNGRYECEKEDDFIPFSLVSSLDFGPTRVGTVKRRRLVLPAALWAAVEYRVELTRKISAFLVEPLKGIIGPRDPVSLWLQFAPRLNVEYSEDILIFLGRNSSPHRVTLTGNGVPLQTAGHNILVRRKSCEVLESSPQLGAAHVSDPEHCRTPQTGEQIEYDQLNGQAGNTFIKLNSKEEQLNPENCVETPAATVNAYLTEGKATRVSTPHRLKHPLRRRECTTEETNYPLGTTSATKRIDSNKYGDGATSKQSLDERWAELVAVLRAQKLGTHTVKGATQPSDTVVQKIQLKRAEEVQKMLKNLQIQDRNRSSCTFAGAAVAPSRNTQENHPDPTSNVQEKGPMLQQLWRSELTKKFQQAAAAVVLRTRMARRLEALRSWIRSHSLREEANQAGIQGKQHQNTPPKCLDLPQRAQERNIEQRCQQGIPTHTDTTQQYAKSLSGLSNSPSSTVVPVLSGPDGSTNARSSETPGGVQGQDAHSFGEENRWKVKLVPPRLSLSTDINGESEWQSIPGPQFWGKEDLNVAELFTCMQHNAPLSPLSKRDIDVFHLKEEDVVTCTGGLEVTDADLLQSLLEATPPLIDDKSWTSSYAANPDDAGHSMLMRSASQGINGVLDSVALLPPEDPEGLAAVAWRFVASVPPYSSACMQLPSIVETDLAYIFLQAASQAKTDHAVRNIFPPFAEIPPLRCNVFELTTVPAGALWPPGAHQRSIRSVASNFVEQASEKTTEATKIDALEPAVAKDAYTLAFEECGDRAEALKRDSNALKNIWGLARCEQVELLSEVNKTLPQEFQIPYL